MNSHANESTLLIDGKPFAFYKEKATIATLAPECVAAFYRAILQTYVQHIPENHNFTINIDYFSFGGKRCFFTKYYLIGNERKPIQKTRIFNGGNQYNAELKTIDSDKQLIHGEETSSTGSYEIYLMPAEKHFYSVFMELINLINENPKLNDKLSFLNAIYDIDVSLDPYNVKDIITPIFAIRIANAFNRNNRYKMELVCTETLIKLLHQRLNKFEGFNKQPINGQRCTQMIYYMFKKVCRDDWCHACSDFQVKSLCKEHCPAINYLTLTDQGSPIQKLSNDILWNKILLPILEQTYSQIKTTEVNYSFNIFKDFFNLREVCPSWSTIIDDDNDYKVE